jgi:hypothetical protein
MGVPIAIYNSQQIVLIPRLSFPNKALYRMTLVENEGVNRKFRVVGYRNDKRDFESLRNTQSMNSQKRWRMEGVYKL